MNGNIDAVCVRAKREPQKGTQRECGDDGEYGSAHGYGGRSHGIVGNYKAWRGFRQPARKWNDGRILMKKRAADGADETRPAVCAGRVSEGSVGVLDAAPVRHRGMGGDGLSGERCVETCGDIIIGARNVVGI